MKNFKPGDLNGVLFTIQSPRQDVEINLLPFIIHIDIYEDIGSPTMICDILMKDDVNLIKNLPIVGEEVVTMVFSTPSLPPSIFRFKVFEVDNEIVARDLTNKTYVLRCVSDESLLNARKGIDIAISGTVDSSVNQIMKNIIKTNKSIFTEACKGFDTYVFPSNITPFQGIDFLRRKAVSQTYPSSSFVFFENQLGFNFVTVEKLIDDGLKRDSMGGVRVYRYSPIAQVSGLEDKVFRNIINYSVTNRTDTVHKYQSGAFKTEVRTFDFVSKQYDVTTYTIDKLNFKTTDQQSRLQNTRKQIGDVLNERVVPNLIYLPKTADNIGSFVHEAVGPRHMFSSLLGEMTVVAHIYGDSTIKVGDMIKCELKTPEIYPATDARAQKNKPREPEKNITGNFIVSKLRHIISNRVNFNYTMSVELVKIGASL